MDNKSGPSKCGRNGGLPSDTCILSRLWLFCPYLFDDLTSEIISTSTCPENPLVMSGHSIHILDVSGRVCMEIQCGKKSLDPQKRKQKTGDALPVARGNLTIPESV